MSMAPWQSSAPGEELHLEIRAPENAPVTTRPPVCLAISICNPPGGIEKHGYFEIRGDAAIMDPLDSLLKSFIAQHRMKLPVTDYVPCYRIIK